MTWDHLKKNNKYVSFLPQKTVDCISSGLLTNAQHIQCLYFRVCNTMAYTKGEGHCGLQAFVDIEVQFSNQMLLAVQ